jgi:hypothetical protein
VFTFVLLGKQVTVALGPKGNNFILGGKSIVFNAEDAYTVRGLHTIHLKANSDFFYRSL